MQLFFFQNLSSLNLLQIVSFSTIDGIDHPPEPILRKSIVSPASIIVRFPTIEPFCPARTCSSSLNEPSVISKSSIIGSDSDWSSHVSSDVSPIVCLVL